MISRRYSISEPSRAEAHYIHFAERIEQAAASRDWTRAQEHAQTWSHGLARDLRLEHFAVWKEFKRALAGRWFGRPERRVFPAPWQPTDVLSYAAGFLNRNVRVSAFPAGIACHARSERLPAGRGQWPDFIGRFDRGMLIEVFPESSTPTSCCFRRYCTAFGEEIIYEVGRGQAMPVFESEQGQHTIASAQRVGRLDFSFGFSSTASGNDFALTADLKQLIVRHDRTLQSKCSAICRRTGIDWTSIEGYFDPMNPACVTIVDLDLPFDYVFMLGGQTEILSSVDFAMQKKAAG